MSEALINRLVEFAESGNQQKIILNGNSYKDFWLKFEDLTQAELYYWDTRPNEWVPFKL